MKAFRMTLLSAILLSTLPIAGQERTAQVPAGPVISETASAVEQIAPIARDGYKGFGILRKPPGPGPFPAVVVIHGGLARMAPQGVRRIALGPTPTRFLAAGYVIAAITYRGRDDDPQSRVSLEDSLAAVNYLRTLPYVDAQSITVYGSSGGGDLALEVAAVTDVAAIAPEEPATVLFTGVFNKAFAKQGATFTPADAGPIANNPRSFYTAENEVLTRGKVAKIRCPILIVQGDQHWINRFNAEVFIPELRAAGKTLDVMTYPGEQHGFAFRGDRPAAEKAFQDINAFFKRYIKTQPKPIAGRSEMAPARQVRRIHFVRRPRSPWLSVASSAACCA